MHPANVLTQLRNPERLRGSNFRSLTSDFISFHSHTFCLYRHNGSHKHTNLHRTCAVLHASGREKWSWVREIGVANALPQPEWPSAAIAATQQPADSLRLFADMGTTSLYYTHVALTRLEETAALFEDARDKTIVDILTSTRPTVDAFASETTRILEVALYSYGFRVGSAALLMISITWAAAEAISKLANLRTCYK